MEDNWDFLRMLILVALGGLVALSMTAKYREKDAHEYKALQERCISLQAANTRLSDMFVECEIQLRKGCSGIAVNYESKGTN